MSRTYLTIPGVLCCLLLPLPTWAVEQRPEESPGVQHSNQQPAVSTSAEIPLTVHEGDLTLLQAQEQALKHNAELNAQAWALKSEEGLLQQAGLWPNPELSIEVENFAGDDGMGGFDSSETTVAISQLFELGGKRSKRVAAAARQKSLALFDYEAKRLDVLNEVARDYIRLVAAQNRLKQAEVLHDLARAVHLTVTERVDAGKVSPVEQTRSSVVSASARLVVENAKRDLDAARRQLAARWGSHEPRFGTATDNLDTSADLVSLDQLLPLLRQNPDVARWDEEQKKSQAELSLAEARSIPDVSVSLGIRRFQENDNQALVAGLQLPLPLFDRNQGERKAAISTLNKVRFQKQAALSRTQADLASAYQALASAHAELSILTREILPGAESAFEAASLGYREGKFALLDVLDAQRTLFEVRGQFVSSLVNYHLAKADIERLIAQPLSSVLSTSDTSHEVTQ